MISPREHPGPLSGRYNDVMLSLALLCLEKQEQAAEEVLLRLWQWLEYRLAQVRAKLQCETTRAQARNALEMGAQSPATPTKPGTNLPSPVLGVGYQLYSSLHHQKFGRASMEGNQIGRGIAWIIYHRFP